MSLIAKLSHRPNKCLLIAKLSHRPNKCLLIAKLSHRPNKCAYWFLVLAIIVNVCKMQKVDQSVCIFADFKRASFHLLGPEHSFTAWSPALCGTHRTTLLESRKTK